MVVTQIGNGRRQAAYLGEWVELSLMYTGTHITANNNNNIYPVCQWVCISSDSLTMLCIHTRIWT